jgi:AcrR family transcriptional regulator
MSDPVPAITHEPSTEAGDGLPAFRRATPDDAVNFAKAAFLAEERVDMGTLAAHLGVSRATLHRWFGTRDQLLERMFVELTTEFSATARATLTHAGIERVMEYVTSMVRMTVPLRPVQLFAQREPQLALRLLVSEHGAVQETLVQTMLAVAAETGSHDQSIDREPAFKAGVKVGMALQYAGLASGEEPQIERIVEIVRAVILGASDPEFRPSERRS